MVNTVMASLNTKLWEISHNIHLNLTAKSNISTTEIHINATKNNRSKSMVLGSTVTCKVPRKTRRISAQTKAELYPTSRSP